jgi:hypothetical protein
MLLTYVTSKSLKSKKKLKVKTNKKWKDKITTEKWA